MKNERRIRTELIAIKLRRMMNDHAGKGPESVGRIGKRMRGF
jgi:hypothetical protein